jgi:hypothetical protein
VNVDEHLVFVRHRSLDLGDAEDLWRAIPVVDYCSHTFAPRG